MMRGTLIWAGALVSLFALPLSGQSLAELAKKEKERREKNREQNVQVRTLSGDDGGAAGGERDGSSRQRDKMGEGDIGEPELHRDSDSVGIPPTASLPVGPAAPDFALPDLDGRRVSLRDFRGKPVLVDFWATWCGPCRQTMPHIEALHREFAPRGLQVLAINVEGRTPEVLAYLRRGGYGFRVLFDSGNWKSPTLRSYGVDSIPRSFLLDREGRIVYAGHPSQLSGELIEAALP